MAWTILVRPVCLWRVSPFGVEGFGPLVNRVCDACQCIYIFRCLIKPFLHF
ncbi:hypothetical protein Hanom_Chr16g01509171 [Helianthus anomalus]